MVEASELYQSGKLSQLSDQIDDVSTRLIIDGVHTLAASDFETLAGLALSADQPAFAHFAATLAAAFTGPSAQSIPEMTGLLSSGLVKLRQLLDDPANAIKSPGADSTVSPTTNEPAANNKSHPAKQRAEPSPIVNSIAADKEMIQEFITESGEHLSTIESQMLLLEKDASSAEALNSVFRAFHTIKGLAGFLEFENIQALAHQVETLLDLARTGQLEVTPSMVDLILECTDIVQKEVQDVNLKLAGKPMPPTAVTEALLQRIRRTSEAGLNPVKDKDGVAPTVIDQPAPSSPAEAAAPEQKMSARADNASVRIDTGKLDQLMDMVGEMVIAQTLIGHSPALSSVKDATLLRNLTQLARITTDVQRITTGMRMVPIGIQFQKTARLVRDLSRRAGKEIVFEATGEDTELDKTILEELADPLLHMVRNSVDHGIETPSERLAAGKEPTARIKVAAYHRSGQIVVAISDDGRGLNRERILQKAIQNGIVQPGAQLSDNDIFHLIFEAGFSTAEKITDISGRGVGMDVVRKHVQKLRGRIEIESRPGEGATFFLKLPLTLAIIEGLVVIVGAQRYIVPIFSVKEMFRPSAEMLSTVQNTCEMALVRGSLLPVVRLHRRFNVEGRTANLTEGVLIVAETEGHQFCLFVDDLVGKQEVVIKSLGESFKRVDGIAGCAILGDGRVGLILDMDGIYKGRS